MREDPELRSLGSIHRLDEPVVVLPVEVPIENLHEPLLLAVRLAQGHGDVLAQEVHVRSHRVDLGIYGELPLGFHFLPLFARFEHELFVVRQERVQALLDRFLGEMDADLGLVALHLAARVIVHLEDHIAVGCEVSAYSLGESALFVAGRPSRELALDLDFRPAETGVAVARLRGVALSSLAFGFHEPKHVVHHAAIAGFVLHSLHPAVFGHARGDHEAAVDIFT